MSDNKHTPEPWRWEINLKHKSVQIVGGRPMYDKTVMDFERWGLQGASPRFNEKVAGDEFNVMTRLCDRPDWIAPFEGRRHHADWCANVTHPDARRIVACVNACAGIKTEDLEAMRETSILAKANTWADGIAKQRDELLVIANKCRLDLLHQIQELADHIERANYCIGDQDMLKQINGQRQYAMEVASKWNQNGNPFEAIVKGSHSEQPLEMVETSAPAIVFYPAGSLGEPVEDPIVPCDDASTGHITARIIHANPAEI